MWRKITVLAVVVSLIVFIVPTGGYAAPDRKVSETVLDDDEYLRARADFERKVEAAGGRAFDSKEKLWQWIVRQGLAEMLGRQFDKLPEADLYLAFRLVLSRASIHVWSGTLWHHTSYNQVNGASTAWLLSSL